MEANIAQMIVRHLMNRIAPPAWTPEMRREVEERLTESVAEIMRERLGKPILPRRGESLALSILAPKTAALAFDRVYRIPILEPELVPEEIGFYCATPVELGFLAYGLLAVVAEKELGIQLFDRNVSEQSAAEAETENLRLLVSQHRAELGLTPTLFYHARASCRREFPKGPREILAATISEISIVDEKQISWAQVLEFRKDIEIRNKYRRVVRWIDDELKSKSPTEVQDLIALRLDDYEFALKKHGLRATIGALSCLIDPKFLGATSATIAATGLVGGKVWAALAGTSIAVGRSLLNFGSTYIDGLEERRGNNYEVAYVHEVRKEFS